MAGKNLVKCSITIVKAASWLMLLVFLVVGVANFVNVLQGGGLEGADQLPKWAAPLVLLALWGVGLFVFSLYYLIGSAVELLVDIRDNTKRA